MHKESSESERISTYRESLSANGESPLSLKWLNYKAAAQRYKQLVADLDIADKRILDAGCGMGDLLPYLLAQSDQFQYLGVDIVPEFVVIAQKRYAGYNFEALNPFENLAEQTFDIIISSGVMNANTSDWQSQRKQKIATLFDHTNEVLSFNMAGSMGESRESKNIGYASVEDIFAFCCTLTPKIILRNHYNNRDFTIVMFK